MFGNGGWRTSGDWSEVMEGLIFIFFLYVYDSEQLSGGGSGTVIAASAKQLG